jgi:hypothetical protein
LPYRRRTDALDLIVLRVENFVNSHGENKIGFFNGRYKGEHRRMNAQAAVVAMLKRQVAIAIFSPVLVQLMTVGIMLYQVIGKITFIVVLVRMMVVMREEFREFDRLFRK